MDHQGGIDSDNLQFSRGFLTLQGPSRGKASPKHKTVGRQPRPRLIVAEFSEGLSVSLTLKPYFLLLGVGPRHCFSFVKS
jgi:hypothetical protein